MGYWFIVALRALVPMVLTGQLKRNKTNIKITLRPIIGVKPEFSEWVLDAYVSVSLTAAAHHSAWSKKLTYIPTNWSYECTNFLRSPSCFYMAFLPYELDISPSQPTFASRDHKSSYVGISLSDRVCCKWSCLPCVPVVLVRKTLATGKATGRGYFLHCFKRKKDEKWLSLLLPIFFKKPFVFC